MGAGYAIMECFADPMQFPKRLLEKDELPVNCESLSLHAFMTWVYLTFRGEEPLKLVQNIRSGIQILDTKFRIGIEGSQRKKLGSTY